VDKQEIIKQIAQLGKDFHNAQCKIMKEHHDINASNDARITVFTNCYIVLDGIYICLVVRSYEICELDWWSKLVQENKVASEPSIEAPQ
jgi:hypothetical protein